MTADRELPEAWRSVLSADRSGADDPTRTMGASPFESITVGVLGESVPPGSSAPAPTADDRFIAKHLIGVGGQGEVWSALQVDLQREVALKRLRSGGADDAAAAARFAAEARTTAQLDHPGVVAVHDAGAGWLAMKRLRGVTLDAIVRAAHAAGSDAVLAALPAWIDHLLRVGECLTYAHAQGVVHRDLKPANIMTGDYGEVVVLDWGLALRIGNPRAPSGTPAFMPPETAQMLPGTVSSDEDVYLYGALLFTLCCGHGPHHAATVSASLRHAMRNRPPELPTWVPTSLRDLIQALMADDAQQRPKLAAAMTALRAIQQELSAISTARQAVAEGLAQLAEAEREVPAPAALAARYAAFSKASEAFDRACACAAQDAAANAGRQRTRRAWSACAVQAGDLVLAEQVLLIRGRVGAGLDNQAEAVRRAQTAKIQQRRRQRRWAYAAAVSVLLLLLSVAGLAAWHAHILSHDRQARLAEAQQLLRDAEARVADDGISDEAQVHAAIAETEQALGLAPKLSAASSLLARLHLALAHAASERRAHALADQSLRHALRIDPDLAATTRALAQRIAELMLPPDQLRALQIAQRETQVQEWLHAPRSDDAHHARIENALLAWNADHPQLIAAHQRLGGQLLLAGVHSASQARISTVVARVAGLRSDMADTATLVTAALCDQRAVARAAQMSLLMRRDASALEPLLEAAAAGRIDSSVRSGLRAWATPRLNAEEALILSAGSASRASMLRDRWRALGDGVASVRVARSASIAFVHRDDPVLACRQPGGIAMSSQELFAHHLQADSPAALYELAQRPLAPSDAQRLRAILLAMKSANARTFTSSGSRPVPIESVPDAFALAAAMVERNSLQISVQNLCDQAWLHILRQDFQPDAHAHMLFGVIVGQGRARDALAISARLLEQEPWNAQAHERLVNNCGSHFEARLAAADLGLERLTDITGLHRQRGAALTKLDRYDDAAVALNLAMRHPVSRLYEARGVLEERRRRPHDALRWYLLERECYGTSSVALPAAKLAAKLGFDGDAAELVAHMLMARGEFDSDISRYARFALERGAVTDLVNLLDSESAANEFCVHIFDALMLMLFSLPAYQEHGLLGLLDGELAHQHLIEVYAHLCVPQVDHAGMQPHIAHVRRYLATATGAREPHMERMLDTMLVCASGSAPAIAAALSAWTPELMPSNGWMRHCLEQVQDRMARNQAIMPLPASYGRLPLRPLQPLRLTSSQRARVERVWQTQASGIRWHLSARGVPMQREQENVLKFFSTLDIPTPDGQPTTLAALARLGARIDRLPNPRKPTHATGAVSVP